METLNKWKVCLLDSKYHWNFLFKRAFAITGI